MTATRSAFRERLAYYLMGVAIGLVLLGLLYMNRAAAVRRQTAPPSPPAAPR